MCAYDVRMYERMHVCVCITMYVRTHVWNVCNYVCMHVCMHVYLWQSCSACSTRPVRSLHTLRMDHANAAQTTIPRKTYIAYIHTCMNTYTRTCIQQSTPHACTYFNVRQSVYKLYHYACVCVYVRMYVRMYVCMHVCMYVCMHVCMYGYMYVCMYVCTYVCMSVCVYACMFVWRCVWRCVCMCVRMYVYVWVYVCRYVHVCMVCMVCMICA